MGLGELAGGAAQVAVGGGGLLADVGDEQHPEAPGGQLAQQREHPRGRGRVEGRRGLVEQEKFRVIGQGAGQGEALLLAPREAGGVAGQIEPVEPDAIEQRAGVAVREGGAPQPRPGREVVEDRAREHHGLLGDVGDAAAEGLRGERQRVDSAQDDLPLRQRIEAPEGAQQRGLAAPGGALDRDHLAPVDPQAGAAHGRGGPAVDDEPAALERAPLWRLVERGWWVHGVHGFSGVPGPSMARCAGRAYLAPGPGDLALRSARQRSGGVLTFER
jgi:hypothetical protein